MAEYDFHNFFNKTILILYIYIKSMQQQIGSIINFFGLRLLKYFYFIFNDNNKVPMRIDIPYLEINFLCTSSIFKVRII